MNNPAQVPQQYYVQLNGALFSPNLKNKKNLPQENF